MIDAKHNRTFCNAFAESRPLSVYTLRTKAKIMEESLRYKECRLVQMQLAEGERIDFKLEGLSVGTFRASGLPHTAANMELVPYHHTKGK